MGLESRIDKIPKKRLELYRNLVAVGVIFTIVFAALFIMFNYSRNPLGFFKTQEFVYVCLSLLLLSLAWKILHGAKMNFPQDLKKKSDNKKPFDKKKKYQSKRVDKPVFNQQKYKEACKKADSIKTTVGSWRCPKCNTYVIGPECPSCKYRVIHE